ncbi:glycine betaine ABC transporter substrate-binding protein [Plebeiibacterium sediminum]|uniref:Glycine betaine ABC transporter substrate-binding protein n=1 Tax=Plebeiibacterium sediminum TaxID=2992112 RepID=A0AAE3SH79_9BACT|nr:glycine betaine ABC transporter substrate-binding protein [Plebeiobacterium sediminum]MCW3788912.1 glycine betaine ABC transporter substrate-binding protein [Plebeiobacterium sediminum]
MTRYLSGTKTVVFIIVLSFLVSCTMTTTQEEDRSLKIVYTDWSESVAITYLSSVLLQKMDYNVELKLTDVKTAYQEVADNKADLFTDAWLPETHKAYYEAHKEHIDMLGIVYPEAKIGLVVPEYSPLKSISDLGSYDFDIVGIDAGAGVMQKTKNAINEYLLKNTLLELSEEKMVNQLNDSILRRKDIVITGWEPHWIFARYEVRFLEDPDHIFGSKENIYTITNTEFEEAHPDAVRFFERMQLTEKQLNSLVYEIRLHDDPVIGVEKWINQNEFVVNQWIKNLTKERKKIM